MNEPTDPSDLPTGTEHANRPLTLEEDRLLILAAQGDLDPEDFAELDRLRDHDTGSVS